MGEAPDETVDERPSHVPERSRWTGAAWHLVVLVYVLLVVVPWQPRMPALGLDASWALVLTEALAGGWQWGRDIAYTGGPYSFVYSAHFHPALFPALLAIWIGLGLVFGAALLRLSSGAPPGVRVAVVLAATYFVSLIPDPLFLALPFFAAEVQLRRSDERVDGMAIALVAASAIVSMAKTTPWMLAAFVCVALDVRRTFVVRRVPVFTPTYLAALLLAYVFAGQRLADLAVFLRSMAALATGFDEAMQLTGPWTEIAHHLALAVLVAVVCLATDFVGGRPRPGWSRWIVRMACTMAFVFLGLKAGFVRHDGHALFAWQTLGLVAAVRLADAARAEPPRWAAVTAAVALALVVLGSVASFARHFGIAPLPFLTRAFVTHPLENASAALAGLSHPAAWVARLREQYDASLAAIRTQHPLPGLAGPVDIIPSAQSVVIANGLDYAPRPHFQEFSNYTHAQIAENRKYITGPRAPQTILFALDTIDGRLPALVEGPLWPDLARWFDPVDLVDRLVVFRHRDRPRDVRFGPAAGRVVKFDEDVTLPDRGVPLWATISLHKTVSGTLAGILFKAPIVFVSLQGEDGSVRQFRLIPAIAREGFLLSPAVLQAADAVPVLVGGPLGSRPRVTSLRLAVEPWGRFFYRDAIGVSFAALQIHGEPERKAGAALQSALAP